MIIDVRCRLTTREAGNYFLQNSKSFGRVVPVLEDGSEEASWNELAEAGITTAVSVSGNSPGMQIGRLSLADRTTSNDLMAAMQRSHPGKFVGVAGIDAGNKLHNALDEIQRCWDLGLRAVFIEPGRSPGCNLDNPRLYPIYQKCHDLDMTLIPQTSGPLGGKSVDYANPVYLERVAEDFPKLRIIAGHACFPYIREMIVVAGRWENVWVSPDMYFFTFGTDDWVQAVNDNFRGFEDRFLFGSAYPAVAIKPYIEKFMRLPWRENVLPKILYGNALRALNLESDPSFQSGTSKSKTYSCN
jgi:predicted TIM-barrel fold metal-dependent hydrolase